LQGIKVVEVAAWAFVPSAGAVLADWGAEVIKVEPATSGDPLRGLQMGGLLPPEAPTVNFMVELMNRGKRSVALDLRSELGRDVLFRLVDSADVFLTSMLPAARRKLGIDVEDIQGRKPGIVYARGTGWGAHGPEAEKGGFDAASFTARGGIANALTPPGSLPVPPRPAFGDIMSGLTLAGGVAAALVQRERTGTGPVVDVSLLGTAAWNLAPDLAAAKLYEGLDLVTFEPGEYPNPVTGTYATADGRFLTLVLLESDRFWPELVQRMGLPELADDPRFTTMASRYQNRVKCCGLLADRFGSESLSFWKDAFDGFEGVWAPVATALEVADDPQVTANQYMQPVETLAGPFRTVSSPVQFDGAPPDLHRAPEHGEHTDDVLTEAGFDMDQILQLKIAGAVL
jgi:crotonobetainyl-CoA:carnitine CoA-transferase CaiB-like acyl-CoA transferase